MYAVKTGIRATALGAFFAVSSFTFAQASTVIMTETGTAQETEFGFRDSTITRGVDLVGAKVTATFDDNTSETRSWIAFDAYTFGGVNGTDWSLYQGGSADVSLVSNGRVMTSLIVDLTTSVSVNLEFDPMAGRDVAVDYGASLFDVTSADEDQGSTKSTDGTSFGFPFEYVANAPTGTTLVTYSGAVNIQGDAAKGDVFTTMTVDFTGLDVGGFTGSSVYRSDQDTLRVAGDLRPMTSAVPLPAALPLLLASLGGLGVMRRRRKAAPENPSQA